MKTIFHSHKNRTFSKGLTHPFGKKMHSFSFLLSVKITLKIRFNNALDRKKSLFQYKDKIFQSPKHRTFPIGLTRTLVKKMQFFSLFVFGQNKTRKKI